MPRRPLPIEDHRLAERLAQLSELDQDDRTSVLSDLDAMNHVPNASTPSPATAAEFRARITADRAAGPEYS
jgi:hypothetical protein